MKSVIVGKVERGPVSVGPSVRATTLLQAYRRLADRMTPMGLNVSRAFKQAAIERTWERLRQLDAYFQESAGGPCVITREMIQDLIDTMP